MKTTLAIVCFFSIILLPLKAEQHIEIESVISGFSVHEAMTIQNLQASDHSNDSKVSRMPIVSLPYGKTGTISMVREFMNPLPFDASDSRINEELYLLGAEIQISIQRTDEGVMFYGKVNISDAGDFSDSKSRTAKDTNYLSPSLLRSTIYYRGKSQLDKTYEFPIRTLDGQEGKVSFKFKESAVPDPE